MPYNITRVEPIKIVRHLEFPDPSIPDLGSPPRGGLFDWSGIFSGHAYLDGRLAKFAATCTGDATYLCTWAGGDSHTIIRIVDGEVYEHEVQITAGPAVMQFDLDGEA